MSTATQSRGICQVCGREQAIMKTGRMFKHGYTVEHGWFNGVCAGEDFVPVQVSRTETDRMVADIARQVVQIRAEADAMEAGDVDPEHVFKTKYEGHKSVQVPYPFHEASQYDQDQQRRTDVFRMRRRAEMGEQHAAMMTGIADKYHGQPVRIVEKAEKTAPIKAGDKKVFESGRVATAIHQEGARVYWTMPRDGKVFRGWTGTQAWRKMPDA
jgi:hypothetical protein